MVGAGSSETSAVDVLGFAFAAILAIVVVVYALRERRWWSWLQMAGIAVLTLDAVIGRDLPAALRAGADLIGPPLLVAGLVAWRLHWDAGWFGGDRLRPPAPPATAAAADAVAVAGAESDESTRPPVP